MLDLYIFGFGLVVTVLVGAGLVTMVLAKNRALESGEDPRAALERPAPVPVRAEEHSATDARD